MRVALVALLFFGINSGAEESFESLLGLTPPSRVAFSLGGGNDETRFHALSAQLTVWEANQLLLMTGRVQSDAGDTTVTSQRFMLGFATDPIEIFSGEISYNSENDLTKIYWNRSMQLRGTWAPGSPSMSWFSVRLGGESGQLSVVNTPNIIFSNNTVDFPWNSLDAQINFFLIPKLSFFVGLQRAWYPNDLNYLSRPLAPLFIPFESISFASSLPSEVKKIGLNWSLPFLKKFRPFVGFSAQSLTSFMDHSVTGMATLDLGAKISKSWNVRISTTSSRLTDAGDTYGDTTSLNKSIEIEVGYQF